MTCGEKERPHGYLVTARPPLKFSIIGILLNLKIQAHRGKTGSLHYFFRNYYNLLQ